MKKFQRNYWAEFEIGYRNDKSEYVAQEVVTVKYPVTCNLYIDVGTYSSANKAVFQFFNLPRNIQAKLWLDEYENGKKYVSMKFYAGYGENMPLVFSGDFLSCTSYLQSGAVDWITEINAFNAGDFLKYGYVNDTFSKGTKLVDILNYMLKNVKGIEVGYITPKIPPLPRNTTFIGQTWDILGRHYGGYEVFIDNYGQFNILDENEVLPGQVQVINDETGLLGSPRRANLFTEIDTIFEPGLVVGQAVSLLSKLMPEFNRAYEIVHLVHKGIISPVVCGKLITTATLTMFPGEPTTLEKQIQTSYNGTQTQGIWLKPVQGIVSSPFGQRNAPIQGASTDHHGIDIAAQLNTTVIAPANGKVINAKYFGGYGKYIQIDHGKNEQGKLVTSAYGHLNNWLVTEGQTVYAGQPIGLVGSTGRSTGPHLHFEVRVNQTPVNPTLFIGTY